MKTAKRSMKFLIKNLRIYAFWRNLALWDMKELKKKQKRLEGLPKKPTLCNNFFEEPRESFARTSGKLWKKSSEDPSKE